MSEPTGRQIQDTDLDSVSSFTSDVSITSSFSSSSSSSLPGLQLPTLPDLRFEQSYLSSIQPYLHPVESESSCISSHEQQQQTTPPPPPQQPCHESRILETMSVRPLQVQWLPIVYVTLRDQLISPLIQGIVWGIAGLLIGQFTQYLKLGFQAPSSSSSPTSSLKNNKPRSLLNALGLGQ